MNKIMHITMALIMALGASPAAIPAPDANADAIEVTAGQINTASDTALVEYLSSYATGNTSEDGGVAEIVKYNKDNGQMVLVSGFTQTLDIAEIHGDGTTETVKKIDIAQLGEENGFDAGDITSVDINTERDLLAIAVQNSDYASNGAIVTLTYDGEFVSKYEAGVQPDMVTFTPDGSRILSANEGEPREGYEDGDIDPMGSVTVVDLESDAAVTVTFEEFDENRDALIGNGVLLKAGAMPSADLEPEYIAVSDTTAYITLQENNAVASLDLNTLTWNYVKGLGFKDHSADGSGLDLNKNKEIGIQNEDVYGVYMPDGIALTTIGGVDYLVTANEGDAREWGDYANTDTRIVNGSKKEVECLISAATDGLDENETYLLGARSFSIWEADTLTQVFDSGDDFEAIPASLFPEYFNAGHDEAGEVDARSNKKGPEPETVAVIEVGGAVYAVIGLERMGGIMVYDITDPANAVYADYLNVRDFTESDLSKAGDLGPEGICTIPAEVSPTGRAMILAANEISGTVTVAQFADAAEENDTDMCHFEFNEAWLEEQNS